MGYHSFTRVEGPGGNQYNVECHCSVCILSCFCSHIGAQGKRDSIGTV